MTEDRLCKNVVTDYSDSVKYAIRSRGDAKNPFLSIDVDILGSSSYKSRPFQGGVCQSAFKE